jgi:GNAT superfamily N-acetyltransferase
VSAPIDIREVTSAGARREFFRLPMRLHRDHPRWVPPLHMDERRRLDPKANRALAYCDMTMALAYRDGRAVGRIVGLINRRYNELRGEQTARFTHLECTDEFTVCAALLDYAETWARQNGMNRIIGPMGFTDQDPEGFLIEGFEHEPALESNYNFPFMSAFMEQAGYTKDVDYVVYMIPVPATSPGSYEKIAARIQQRAACKLVEFTRRAELKAYIHPVLNLLNDTYRDLTGFAPLDEREREDLARRFLPVIDPRFVKIVALHSGEVVGFVIGMPNVNDGLRKSGGRLFPFGWFHILRAMKRARQLDLLLGGIREDFRARGVDVLLGEAMIRSARDAGFTHMDSHHELETNFRVRPKWNMPAAKSTSATASTKNPCRQLRVDSGLSRCLFSCHE